MRSSQAPDAERHDGGGLWSLGLATGLWTFGIALSAPFLDAYLWSLRPSWTLIAWFNLAQYGAMVATFPVAGRIARGGDAQRPLRYGAVAVGAAFVAVLVSGSRTPGRAVPIGLLLGVGWGLYWLAQFVLGLDLTSSGAGRDRWQAITGLLTTGSGLAAPAAAGVLVAAVGRSAGFRWLLAAGLGFLAAALGAARRLPDRAATAGGRYRLRDAWPERGPGPWRYLLLAQVALALRDGVYLFAPALLVYTLSRSALDLGLYLTVTQGISLAAYAAYGRWGRPETRRLSLLLGAALSTAVGCVLAAGLTTLHVWAFGLLSAALQPLLQVPVEACSLDVIGWRAGTEPAARVAHTVVKEVLVNAARLLSVALMVAALALAGNAALRPWLVAVAASPWWAWWAISRFPAPAAPPPARGQEG